MLRTAFYAIKRDAAPGVDGMTWETYEKDLDRRIEDLHARVHAGAYRAQPSRRSYIPKEDGSKRPLAVAALEDKIVQRAVAAVLSAIYEEEFLGFSYGFRPGRSQHDALDALIVGIGSKKVNFILDADIRSFFTEVSQEWVVRFLEHRIGDQRIIRLVQKWLRAGILEDGVVTIEEKGTGQGSVISPLLANVYLHYVFDLWAERWRRREATGDMIMVRYADDIVVGFQHEKDARRFWDAMRERLREFSLSLHPEKTRLIEFGRFAAQNRERRGLGKPDTFKFLGFCADLREIATGRLPNQEEVTSRPHAGKTMHGIDRDHRVGQRKRAEQTLDRRNFIGLFVAVEMRQHQSRVGSEGAEYVRGAAVEKVVEASPQGLAINRHMTLTFAVRRVVQHGGMAAECSFDRGGIELSQDATDRRVSGSFPPLHPERIAQPGEVNIDEAMDCPIRVGAGDDRQNRKQHDVRQPIQLPLRPPRVFDFGQ